MNSQHLKSYLTSVATDSQKLKEFKENPKSAMKSADLSDEQINAVLSGDPKEVVKHIGPIVAGDTVIVIVLAV